MAGEHKSYSEWKNQVCTYLYGATERCCELLGSSRAQHNVKVGEKRDPGGKGQWEENCFQILHLNVLEANIINHQTYFNVIAALIFREFKKFVNL